MVQLAFSEWGTQCSPCWSPQSQPCRVSSAVFIELKLTFKGNFIWEESFRITLLFCARSITTHSYWHYTSFLELLQETWWPWNNRNGCSHSSGGQRSKVKVSAGPRALWSREEREERILYLFQLLGASHVARLVVASLRSLPQLHMAFSLHLPSSQPSSLYKDWSHWI